MEALRVVCRLLLRQGTPAEARKGMPDVENLLTNREFPVERTTTENIFRKIARESLRT
jgi:hypothetical protein